MTNKEFDFWQDHSEKYLEMAFCMDRRERIEKPDGYGKRKGECGDSIEIFLMIENDHIKTASFQIDGCMNTHACASTLTMMAEGRDMKSAWDILPETITDYLETLPEHETHCAELAVGAYYLALKDCE